MEYINIVLEIGLRWLLSGIIVFYMCLLMLDVCEHRSANISNYLVDEFLCMLALLITRTKDTVFAIMVWPYTVYNLLYVK